jgi:hypothetical protein
LTRGHCGSRAASSLALFEVAVFECDHGLASVEAITGQLQQRHSREWPTKMNDVDLLIEQLRPAVAGIGITQLTKSLPGDDDGLWYLDVPDRGEVIQFETSTRNCPILIEWDTSEMASGRYVANSVDEARRKILQIAESGSI